MKRFILSLYVLVSLGFALFAEEGFASYYAGKFQGRLTANGEIFDTKRFTAAHKTLPFNTIVRVTNPANGKSTLTRINDRGPFVEGRIIDLTRAAAAAIGMVADGVAWVVVDVVVEGDGATYHRDGYSTDYVTIQVGAFGELDNAERLRDELSRADFVTDLEPARDGITRVVLRGVPREDVLLVKARLQNLGHFQVLVRRE